MSLPLGVAGSEPTDAPVGSLAYATDTELVRVKKASGWDDVGGGGSATPTGPAGGDLGGTYPNPTVTQARGLKTATTTVSVSAATAPSAGQVLTATSSTAADWETPSASGVTTVAAGTGISVATPTGPTATVSTNFGTTSVTSCVGNDSRLSDSRAPNGSATGDLGGSYPSPTVAALHETSGPTKLTIGTVADLTLLTRVGSTAVGRLVSDFTSKSFPVNADVLLMSNSAASNAVTSAAASSLVYVPAIRRGALWMPPITANGNDVEFDTGSAPSGWAWWKAGTPFTAQTVGSTIDLYRAGYTSGNPEVSYTWRGSHLAFTVPYDNNIYYFLKDFTSLPTDAFFWTRIGTNRRTTSLVPGDCRYEFVITEQTSGAPALNNFVFLQYVYDTNAVPAFRYRWGGVNGGAPVGGAGTASFATPFDISFTEFYPYFGIQKLGTTYYGMLSDDEGNVVDLGSFTVSGTLRYVGLRAGEVTIPADSWTPVRVCDFIRQINTGDGYFGLGQ